MLHLFSTVAVALLAVTGVPTDTGHAGAGETGVAIDEPTRAGLQVLVDPLTGRIIDNPTDVQLEAVARSQVLEERLSAWDLESFPLPGGGEGVFLDGWADHSLVATRAADGTLRLGCSQGDAHPEQEGASRGEER